MPVQGVFDRRDGTGIMDRNATGLKPDRIPDRPVIAGASERIGVNRPPFRGRFITLQFNDAEITIPINGEVI